MGLTNTSRRVALPALLLCAALGAGASGSALQAQTMLTGCQLVGGTLQCVPGVTADPQQQIRDLRQTIAADQQLENAVEQQISGLQQLVLIGELTQGSLLIANLGAGLGQDPLINLPPGAFHWYRLPAGASNWVLINGATGPNYRLQSADVGAQLMVVIAVPAASGSQRQASAAVGPIGSGTP
ncbi:MAG: hypothetical protein VKM98_01205 [Cyanobacteriota bacterium]|nr:hypothetical protein [Cyanobacteriota bacterium]